jgi:hypothetical protein
MCVPAREVLEPFPGALELLHDLQRAGHRLALVSNTQWRSAARYREDFADWGVAGLPTRGRGSDQAQKLVHPHMLPAASERHGDATWIIRVLGGRWHLRSGRGFVPNTVVWLSDERQGERLESERAVLRVPALAGLHGVGVRDRAGGDELAGRETRRAWLL